MSAGDQILNIRIPGSVSRTTRIAAWFGDGIKRLFDIFISSIIIILFAPLYLIIAIAIKRDSPGPAFYRGSRIGRHGKLFKILKFRTMDDNPQSYHGPRVTAHDDPRITPLGRWLRDTKLNEFPQFWNVLKGDMSLVGPRPEDPDFAKTWPIAVREEILSVRPGITSPASVQYHDEEKLLTNCNVEQMYLLELSPAKVRLDQLYVRYRSFLLDLDTLLWTSFTFVPKVGSYKLPEELLFLGVFSRIIRRFLNWFTIDLITTFVAFGLTGLIFRLREPLSFSGMNGIILNFAYAILFSGMGVIFGTNRIRWEKANPTDLFDLVPSWIVATTIAFIANLFLDYLPAELVLIGSVFSLFGFIITRSRTWMMTHFLEQSIIFQKKNELMKERILIIGLGASAQHTAWLFEHLMNSKLFHIVGFVDNDLTKQGSRYFGSNVIGKWDDIPDLVKKHDVGLLILADYRVDTKAYIAIRDICKSTNARFVVMPDILASINHLIKRSSKRTIAEMDPIEQLDSKCIDCLAQHVNASRSGLD